MQRNSFGNDIMLENHHSLLSETPISTAVLRDLQCLHPLARKQSTGRATVAFVVKLSLKMSLILCIFSVLKKVFFTVGGLT